MGLKDKEGSEKETDSKKTERDGHTSRQARPPRETKREVTDEELEDITGKKQLTWRQKIGLDPVD